MFKKRGIIMYLIIGLGNPEKEYEGTRHNMGFDVIDELSKKYNILVEKTKFKGLYGSGTIENEKVVLLKPQTFMNLSGESVREIVDFYKISMEDVIIIYDDIDIDVGCVRIRKNNVEVLYESGYKGLRSKRGRLAFGRRNTVGNRCLPHGGRW